MYILIYIDCTNPLFSLVKQTGQTRHIGTVLLFCSEIVSDFHKFIQQTLHKDEKTYKYSLITIKGV